MNGTTVPASTIRTRRKPFTIVVAGQLDHAIYDGEERHRTEQARIVRAEGAYGLPDDVAIPRAALLDRACAGPARRGAARAAMGTDAGEPHRVRRLLSSRSGRPASSGRGMNGQLIVCELGQSDCYSHKPGRDAIGQLHRGLSTRSPLDRTGQAPAASSCASRRRSRASMTFGIPRATASASSSARRAPARSPARSAPSASSSSISIGC